MQSEKNHNIYLLLFLFFQQQHHNPHRSVKFALSGESVVNLAATMFLFLFYEH